MYLAVRETGTLQAQAFLERHSPRMIRIAKDTSPELLGNRRIARFLDRLHRDFETVEDKPGKRYPLPGEDVFWWCITILEELAEYLGVPGVADEECDGHVLGVDPVLGGFGVCRGSAEHQDRG